MRNIIINADDFGISEGVNEAIKSCFRDGFISNTTIMVNMPAALEAVRIAADEGFFDKVGLHLNLTAGTPLTGGIRSLPLFCNGRGDFHALFHLSTKSRLFIGKRERLAVRDELRAQLERYLALGFKQKHLDSHHHVHTDLCIYNELEPLLSEYGFNSVRLSRNIFEEGNTTAFNRIYKKYLNSRIKKNISKTTDYFGSFRDYMASGDGILDGTTSEIMVHPLFSDDGECLDTDEPIYVLEKLVKDKDVSLLSY